VHERGVHHLGRRGAEPQIMDSSAFERTFGIAPTPLTETIDATLAWYAQSLADRWHSRPPLMRARRNFRDHERLPQHCSRH
jgi:hypothetical protein